MTAGLALGLLLAPDKGSQTRKKILKKGGDLADSFNDKVDKKFNELVSSITGKTKKPERQSDYKTNEM